MRCQLLPGQSDRMAAVVWVAYLAAVVALTLAVTRARLHVAALDRQAEWSQDRQDVLAVTAANRLPLSLRAETEKDWAAALEAGARLPEKEVATLEHLCEDMVEHMDEHGIQIATYCNNRRPMRFPPPGLDLPAWRWSPPGVGDRRSPP
jgi:hypothetical protein